MHSLLPQLVKASTKSNVSNRTVPWILIAAIPLSAFRQLLDAVITVGELGRLRCTNDISWPVASELLLCDCSQGRWFQACRKMPQKRRFVSQMQTKDLVAFLEYIKNDFDDIVNVALRVDAPRDSEAN